MANLLSQNIGTNYKSILNLDATTINTPLDATLRAVTDGMGTSSPLQLSTAKVAIGTILYFNGITSAFPSIKRNGAAIDFRLADDSAFANINTGVLNVDNYALVVQGSSSYFQYNLAIGKSSPAANSSVLDLTSTTKGFLPPRMTTAQVNAIVTPANGLQVYNTDLAQPCFYDGTGWRKVTHTNM